jgi:hypothetical protein
MKPSSLTEGLGWYGVVTILIAYAAISFGWLVASNPVYLLLNLTGSIGIGIDAYAQKNWQPVVLNAVWMAIAVIGIARIFVH